MIAALIAGTIIFALTAFFAVLLTVARSKLAVKDNPRVTAILDVLPMGNCGGCGFGGCSDFAKAVIEERAAMNGCPVGGPGVAAKIAEALGVEVVETFPYRPVLRCGARRDQKLGIVEYDGVQSCVGAAVVGVTQGCWYGCLGFSDCVVSCDHGAIRMEEGLAVFDYDKCTGCGACERACPRNIIHRIPFRREAMMVVACSNKEGPKLVKQVCTVGCVGCKACERMLPDLFTVADRLASIDYDLYSGDEDLAAAKAKCPAGVMVYFGQGQPGMAARTSVPERSVAKA